MVIRPRTGPAPKKSLEPPRPIDGIRKLGRYELLVRLAAGGAANVFLVRDSKAPPPGQLLALKVLLPTLSSNEDFLGMFFTEARIAARLHHPNVVSIAGFGQNDGIHCLAMEYVFGASLSQVLKQSARVKKPLTVGVLLRITATVCDALHHAHELRDEQGKPMGLVHRDVTPQNILIGFNGVPKLTDFGIAKATGRGWETQAGIVKGKFSYMSPEQALGRKIDRRSDIFCTGIVLWEALTGKELFKGTSPMEVIEAIREQPIEPPSKVVPGLSPIVDPIVMKALKRAPRQRYQTADEMRKEIEDLIDRAGVKIDSQTISKEFADIFGDTIVERAFALRAAMAGRGDLDELAKALGGQRLRDDHLPIVPNGESNPDPLGLFSDREEEPEDDISIDEEEPSDAMPARAEQEFTRAFSKAELEKLAAQAQAEREAERAAEAAEPEEHPGYELDEAPVTGSADVVDGWEDNTRMAAPNDELLNMISEGDATVGAVSPELAERLGLNRGSSDDDDADQTLTGYQGGPFDDEHTVDAGRPGILDELALPRAPQGLLKPIPTAPSTIGRPLPGPQGRGLPAPRAPQAPSVVNASNVVLRGTSPKQAATRPVPRAPSLDMQEAVTPRPELELEEQPLTRPASAAPTAPMPGAGSSLPPLAPHRNNIPAATSLATALDEVSSKAMVRPASEETLPPVNPVPLDEPDDDKWGASVPSMPGSAALRAQSSGGGNIPALPGLEASLAPGEALQRMTPELSADALRELIASDQRSISRVGNSADAWQQPQAAPTAPVVQSPDAKAVRLRPTGLILLAILFVALGVALGVLFVKLWIAK